MAYKKTEPKNTDHILPLVAIFTILFLGIFAVGTYLGQTQTSGLLVLGTRSVTTASSQSAIQSNTNLQTVLNNQSVTYKVGDYIPTNNNNDLNFKIKVAGGYTSNSINYVDLELYNSINKLIDSEDFKAGDKIVLYMNGESALQSILYIDSVLRSVQNGKDVLSVKITNIAPIVNVNLLIRPSSDILKYKFDPASRFFKKIILDSNPAYDYSDKNTKYLVPYRLGFLGMSISSDDNSQYCNAKFNIMTGNGTIIQEFDFSSDMAKKEFYKIPFMDLSMRCDWGNFIFRDGKFNLIYTDMAQKYYDEVSIPIMSAYQNGVCSDKYNKYACDIVPYMINQRSVFTQNNKVQFGFVVEHMMDYDGTGSDYLGPAQFADGNYQDPNTSGFYTFNDVNRSAKIKEFNGTMELLDMNKYGSDLTNYKLNVDVYNNISILTNLLN